MTEWYVKQDRTRVNWNTAVVDGFATVNIYRLVRHTNGEEQRILWAAAGQPVSTSQLNAAQGVDASEPVPDIGSVANRPDDPDRSGHRTGSVTLQDLSQEVLDAIAGGSGGAIDSDLIAIANLSPANKALLQRVGGTWAGSTPDTVKADMGLNFVNNTSDAQKNAAAATLTNKAIDGTQNTVTNLPLGAIPELAATLSGRAFDSQVVHLVGAESIGGAKTFTSSPVVPAPTIAGHAATKAYVDAIAVQGGSVPDADPTTKGKLRLAGDLGGTADAPTVPALAFLQPHDTDLDAIAGIDSTLTGVIGSQGVGWVRLGYGTLKTALAITEADVAGLVSDLAGKLSTTTRGAANGIASLDANGLIPTAQIPPVTLGNVFVVASQSAMLALAAIKGDIAIRTDSGNTYILSTNSPTTLADWKQMLASGAVQSVNGATGVVSIDATSVGAPPTTRTITAGTGLTGGGNLSADRTLTVAYGTTAGTAAQGNDSRIAGAAADSTVVHLAGTETITGAKTFSATPTVPTPTANGHAATKAYVDTAAAAGTPNATSSVLGKIQLTGDLGGTATSPTVPGLANMVPLTQKGAANGVASLDGGGKIPTAQIPAIAVGNVFVVASQSAMLALAAIKGDTAVRTDLGSTFILSTNSPSTLADWKELLASGAVQSVNGYTGAITLTATDVSAAPVARQVIAGTGLTGGGTLAADRTLAVVADTTTQRVELAKAGTLIAARKTLNLIEGANITITAVDNSSSNRVDVTIGSSGGAGWNVLVQVPADGATDAAPTIQAVLDALTGGTHSTEVIVEGTTKGTIYLNSKVRISTDNTTVRFRNPQLLGISADPDGFGCLSIKGVSAGTTTVSGAGGTRGYSFVNVASAAGITPGTLVRIYDNDTTGGSTAGYKSELAEVVDVQGLILWLDHPLYQPYTGTVSLERLAPISNSGFDGVNARFTGQQAAGFFFPAKMQYTRNCFFRNMHFKGDRANSWSRECVNLRYVYRSVVENCSASFGWNYGVSSTYDYAFSADGATECFWNRCWASNVRHAFTLDKGSAGCILTQCVATNVVASGFDLHGNWVRDCTFNACRADSSVTWSAADSSRTGFLAGNTSFTNGVHGCTFNACVARNFGIFTSSGGTAGAGYGFAVADGSTGIDFASCKAVECQYGLEIENKSGVPITNITVSDCTFLNITSGSATNVPIQILGGIAAGDIDGVIVEGCRFIAGTNMSAMRIWGASGNQINDVVVSNCTWNNSPLTGTGTVFAVDARFVNDLVVNYTTFNKTGRGISLSNCPGAAITHNTFRNLTNATLAKDTILDSGGNTGFVFAKNAIVGYTPTSWGTAPSSPGCYVDFMPAAVAYATGGRPDPAVAGIGAYYYDITTGQANFSSGTAWAAATSNNSNDPRFTQVASTTKTAGYTFALADAGTVVQYNAGTAGTFTVPPNSSVAFPVGTVLEVYAQGAGQLAVAAGAGVTIEATSLTLRGQFASGSLRQRAANIWVLTGDLT